jgi:dolichyl-diphosphooligosaccharide--protein glycosyltransferase
LFLILLFLPVGLALLVSFFGRNISHKLFIVMLLSVWMAGTIYMSLNGVRFILLLAPAFAIAAGAGLYYIAQYINSYISKEFDIKDKFKQLIPGYAVISIIFLTIFSPMYTQAYAIGNSALPNFDDAWYDAMYKIDNETNQNTIITSWWDFGHFFAAVGNRGVTFDGGSQTTPQSHWVGKLLLEGDEDVSVDILRMLVCGGNLAFDAAFDISNDPTNGVHINEMLYDTFGKSIEEKREVIVNYKYYSFSESDVDSILQYLHCADPRENLVITSGDMVGKTGVWAHWGSWDFTKKYVHDNYNQKSVAEIVSVLDKDEELIDTYVTELRAIDLNSRTQNINREQLINQWFAPYPTYGETVPCVLENTTLVCGGQLGIDILTGEVTNADALGISIHNVVMPAPSELRVYNQNENGVMDILETQSKSGFQIILMQAPLGTSLFTKLYMLNGIGTTKFEEFHTTQTQTAGKVSIWKTNFGEVEGTDLSVNTVEYTVSGEELEELINS